LAVVAGMKPSKRLLQDWTHVKCEMHLVFQNKLY